MKVIAHKYKDGTIQLLSDHLRSVKEKSAEFANAASLDVSHMEQIGYMHDYGKFSAEFQAYIQNGAGRVSHTGIGGRKLFDAHDIIGAFCVFGHHSGLPDKGSRADTNKTLLGRYFQKEELTISEPAPPLKKFVPVKLGNDKDTQAFAMALETRMYLSCLVDADWQDSAERYDPPNVDSWECIYSSFVKKTSDVFSHSVKTDINRWRSEIFDSCCKEGRNGNRSIYSLSSPTGSGKTFSSMAFALERLKAGKARRIIYCIPYTSIIEQNAEVFRSLVGAKNVIEHHHLAGSFITDSVDGEDVRIEQSRTWMVENWDAPVVMTTNVQFFESLLSNKTSRVRKLHNIAGSVIILDEAQMLPVGFLTPCKELLKLLATEYGCTVVLCTATQPGLHIGETEILPDPVGMYERFKRVSAKNIGMVDDVSELAGHIIKQSETGKSVLCVVNRRRTAHELFAAVKSKSGRACYHLSLDMCAEHRQSVIQSIQKDLAVGRPVSVISTSLIEAGVDLSFDVAYRELNGLDSLVQVAGRVNRHGEKAGGVLNVFQLRDMRYEDARMVETAKLLDEEDIFSPDVIRIYFENVYSYGNESTYDVNGIMASSKDFNFETVGKNARLITSQTVPLVVPYNEEAEDLINNIRIGKDNRETWRNIQKYTVSVYENQIKALQGLGATDAIADDVWVLKNCDFYNNMDGLALQFR